LAGFGTSSVEPSGLATRVLVFIWKETLFLHEAFAKFCRPFPEQILKKDWKLEQSKRKRRESLTAK